MNTTIRKINQARRILNDAPVPVLDRALMDENGEVFLSKASTNPTLKSLFPCLRGKRND